MEALEQVQPEWLQGGDPVDIDLSQTGELLVGATSIVAGLATKRLLECAWRAVRQNDPPTNTAAAGVSWKDALIWGAAVGAAMGVSKVLSRRGATEVWRKFG